MDRKYIADNQIIERYLMNKLTSDERVEFEQYYIGDPQTIDELKLAERFMKGFRDLSDNDSS